MARRPGDEPQQGDAGITAPRGPQQQLEPMSPRTTLIAAAALSIALIPAAAVAAPPDGYRVISYRHADGGASSIDGCIGTEIYVGSTDAKYGGRPGPIVKQAGPTDVLVIVSDRCAAPVGKGYPLLALWQGQAMVGLQSNAQFTSASVHALVPVTDDVSGASSTAHLVMTWTATGRATKDPTHLHVRFPGIAVVNSHDNDTMVDAVATGSVTIGGWSASVWTADAHLASVKAGCQVVIHPGAENEDISCV